MDVPQETLQQLRAVKSTLEDLDQHMQPFLEASPKDMSTQLTPLERVKVHLALAQAVVTLYQLHRRLAAASMENHPLQKELERVAAYEKKVKKAITADELARSRPGTSLNIAAANRFIDAAIPDLTPEQKQQLRTLGHMPQKAGVTVKTAAEAAAGSSKRTQQQQDAATEEEEEDQQQHEARDSSDDDKQPKVISVLQQPNKKQKQQHGKQQQRGTKSVNVGALEFLQDVLADVEREGN